MFVPNLVIKIPIVLLFTLHITKNIAHHITEVLIFYADKLMVIGNSKNLHLFNFTILLTPRKSRKFDAREIYMFYSTQCHAVTLTSDPLTLKVCGTSSVT